MPEQPRHFSREVENLISCFRGLPEDGSRARVRDSHGKAVEAREFINQLLTKYRIGQDTEEQRLRESWESLFGTVVATYSHPLVIENGVLIVLCSNSVVRSEIFHQRVKVLEKIRAIPGCRHVKAIHVRTG